MADQSTPVSNEDPAAAILSTGSTPLVLSPMPAPVDVVSPPDVVTVYTDGTLANSNVIAPVTEATIRKLSKPAADWRARLQLAPSADYLYKSAEPGILGPLVETDGVIFPYTPTIETMFSAGYAETQLTHSNFKGYHYTGSHPGVITVAATFTAQDNKEAEYLLAALHFFKSATKMFYGQDYERGTPPPVLFLSAFGEHQYNRVPVVIQDFTSVLPADVHYVRTKYATLGSTATTTTTSSLSPLRQVVNTINEVSNRLQSLGLIKGGSKASATSSLITRASAENTSYVPSKVDVVLTLLPIPNRKQMSQEFSLKDYANGKLVTRGMI